MAFFGLRKWPTPVSLREIWIALVLASPISVCLVDALSLFFRPGFQAVVALLCC